MFHDYRSWTLLSFLQLREHDELSVHLSRPTPGSIRKECGLVYKERYAKSDDRILRGFFGVPKADVTFEEHIRKFDVDKFRPLVNFLNQEVETTEDKNVELLAWLLDLQPRPYQSDHVYEIEERKARKRWWKPKTIKKPTKAKLVTGVSIICVVAAVAFAAYSFWPKNTVAMSVGGPIPPPAKGVCMIWANDHYVTLRCEDRAGRPGVLGVDSGRLANFKRITDTLAINEASVKRVWYFKKNGKIEYYSAPGYHPVDTNRWLKPLTVYMVRKYAQHPVHP